MIPGPVAHTAANADTTGLSPAVTGYNTELAAGQPTPIAVLSIAMLVARTGPHEALGGEPGAWWAAMAVPGFPPEMRPPWLDDWAVERLGQAPHEISVTAAAGELRPTVVADWDRAVEAAETRLHAALVEAFIDALERVARQAGTQVMAWCKDPAVRPRLEPHRLAAVPLIASGIGVTDGRTVWQAAAVNLEDVIAKQADGLRAKAERLVEEHDDEIRAVAAGLFGAAGIGAVSDRDGLVRDLVSQFFEAGYDVPRVGVPSSVAGIVTRSVEVGLPQSAAGGLLARVLVGTPLEGVPSRARGFVESVTRGRVRVSVVRRFVWGRHGKSDNPHPGHRDEADGKTEAELVGSWSPGDHKGCRCGWSRRTLVVTV